MGCSAIGLIHRVKRNDRGIAFDDFTVRQRNRNHLLAASDHDPQLEQVSLPRRGGRKGRDGHLHRKGTAVCIMVAKPFEGFVPKPCCQTEFGLCRKFVISVCCPLRRLNVCHIKVSQIGAPGHLRNRIYGRLGTPRSLGRDRHLRQQPCHHSSSKEHTQKSFFHKTFLL